MQTQTPTREAATRWLRQYDTGEAGFLPSVAFQLAERGKLSDRQWDTVLRIMAQQNSPQAGPAQVGVYRQAGKLYVVREFTPQGESRKVRYAREIVPLSDGQSDRLNQAGDRVRVEERKAPGMQYRLTAADALPIAEVTALSIQWTRCLVCGRALRVAQSVERGIGPVCEGRQAALLALVAA